MASSEIKSNIKRISFTETTNSNGAISLNGKGVNGAPISAYISGGYKFAYLMYTDGWWVAVYQWPDMIKVANTSVDVTVNYI